ncbi:hypothetical protein NQ314_006748 [Rhamnusium bicolor]|uniref:Uncharacterized protein n=1 Tax=Rhamnusium bicolor TaxID=1586634 RepID=A0AAV8YXH6_9CUCU|nr:hypothetical protein NQ314_006748 [Rhamnusium bicolor]
MTGTVPVDPYRATLPEYEVVNFIINSSFTQSLRSYYELYGEVPQREIYKDRVWPIPSDFIPYDVFSKPYDSIVELPKAPPEILTKSKFDLKAKQEEVERLEREFAEEDD